MTARYRYLTEAEARGLALALAEVLRPQFGGVQRVILEEVAERLVLQVERELAWAAEGTV